MTTKSRAAYRFWLVVFLPFLVVWTGAWGAFDGIREGAEEWAYERRRG